MTKIYRLFAAVMLFACGCLFAFQAEARVCFATDPECGEGGNFGDMTDSAENLKNMCLDAGYTTLASDCKADIDKQIGEYCPYDHKYVICCGLEYAYSKCTYPLVATGQCGSKYACECNSSQYPYYQKTSYVCAKAADGTEYQNSLASGGSCAYTGYDRAQHSVTHNIRFTECLCDRGLYPKTEEECAKVGAGTYGNECVDSNGDTFFASCICGKEYEIFADSCKYGTYSKDILCQQGDVYKTKRCCECNSATYPYDDYGDLDDTVETYTTCEHEQGCTRGSRYRATSCNLGYKLGSGSDNGKCVPKTCGEIIQDYLTDKNITSYSVYKSGVTPSTTNVIVGDDTGGAYWSDFANKTVISGQVYATMISGSEPLVKLIKNQCTAAPLITVNGGTSYGTLNFTGVELETSSWTNNSNFTCTNCGISGTSWTVNGITNLNYNSSKPNADNMYVKYTGTMKLSKQFVATGYDFDIYQMDITTNAVKHNFIGRANTNRNTFKVYRLSIREALAMLKYMDASVSYTYMGIPYNNFSTNAVGKYWYYTKSQGCGNDDNYWRTGYFANGNGTPSALHLYDTTYIVGIQLWMSSSTRIGQGLNDGTGLPESGLIKFVNTSSRSFTNLFYPLPTSTGSGYSVYVIDQNGTVATRTYANHLLRFEQNTGDGNGSIDSYCYLDAQAIPHDGMGEHRSGGHGGSDGCRSGKCRYFHDCGTGACRITDDDRDCKAGSPKLNCYVFRHLSSGALKGISATSVSE